MVSVFGALRKAARSLVPRTLLAVTALSLAGCEATGIGGPSIDTSEPVRVALLIPSGSARPGDEILAQALENGARLAMADLDGVAIDLRVYATGGDPARAAGAAVQAVNDGAKIILGPLFADAANAAGVAVAARNINVLSFSNNSDIAGRNVYVLGNTFENTAARLVSYAARQGKGNILVVHDQTPAGEVARRSVEAAIARSPARLAGVQSHAFSQEDVIAAVPNIVAAARSSGAQAVFLTAETATSLPLFAQLLPEAGLDPATIQYIGLTRWDIPPATLSFRGLQGGWFALPDPVLNQQFQTRYAARYGQVPNPIAGLAYDGIAAIGALVKSGRSDALSGAALTQASGFVGVSGVFRLRSDGTNERALAVAQIQNSQVIVIDPAPRSFAGAGF